MVVDLLGHFFKCTVDYNRMLDVTFYREREITIFTKERAANM